jgi:hypothetical protein
MANWKGQRKKQYWPNLRYYPGDCLKKPRETMPLLEECVLAETSTNYFSNTALKHYCLN